MGIFRRDPERAAERDELDRLRADTEARLPPGWRLDLADSEVFRLPVGSLSTWASGASGPGEQATLAVAVGSEAEGLRALQQVLGGHVGPTSVWAPPLPPVDAGGASPGKGRFAPYDEVAPDVAAALSEVQAALPAGWSMFDNDRERYRLPGRKLTVHAVSAAGPDGTAALVVGLGETAALRGLGARLRGELRTSAVWAVPTSDSSARVRP